MSSLDKLVPVLDGTNYRDWSVLMQSYLQMQEIWEVVIGEYRMPREPVGTTRQQGTGPTATTVAVPPTDAEMAQYRAEHSAWNKADNKALGALTLRLAPQIRHYRAATSRTTWTNLVTAFGGTSMSAIYADFKQVINVKLSGGNPVSEIERMATLFGRLEANQLIVPAALQGLMLLAAMPAKWDNVAQLFMQRQDLRNALTLEGVRTAITQEYERTNRPVDKSAHKLSAVKRKGPDPSYRQQQQSQPGPSRQPQQQHGGIKPKKRGGRIEKEKQERRARKQGQQDHSHFASTSRIVEVEPSVAPSYINASQPSRAAPLHSSVASFGKNGIEYRKVVSTPPTKPTLVNSVWPSLNEARELCDAFAIPKTAKNLKPLEAPRVKAPIFPTADPFDSIRKAQKAVKKMIDLPIASTSKVQLAKRISTPPYDSGFSWAEEPMVTREPSREPPVSLGEESPYDSPSDPNAQRILQRWISPAEDGRDIVDPYNFDESDESDSDCPRQIGTLEMRMNIDDDIADAAGLPAKGKGKQRERQVPLLSRNKLLLTTSQCTRGSTSAVQAKEEPLSSDVDYRCALRALVNSLNKIELHTQNCQKCKRKVHDRKAWILDSGASQHFTSSKEDFIDFEVVTNAPEVKTASAKAILRIEGKGSILLSHLVENQGVRTTRIYPVLYIPGLSVKLLSMGSFLQNKQEVRGTVDHITFHHAVTQKPLLSAYPQNPWDTIYWVVPQINKASVATIYKVDYDVWHKRLGHPSKDVLRRAKELKDFPNDLVIPEHSPLCRGCAEGKLHSKSFPESNSRATRLFAIVHSDLKEFPVESYSRYKYLVSFIDDYSSHAWIALLRKKSETFMAFRHFVAMVRNHFKAEIGSLMSDFGGEYKSKAFDDFLKLHGIQVRSSVPHMHQQNGRAERFNRTLMDKAQAMRLDACFPPSWWEFAVNTAVHLYNRTPVHRLKWRTPYELVYGEVPSIKHLRVFGCGAYVHIPAEARKDKLSPRGELMIFLGYPEGVKGYLFMRLPNNVLFKGTTAIFDEEMMPKCDKTVKRRFTPVGDKIPKPSKEDPPIPLEEDSDADFPRHRRSPSPVQRDNAESDDDLSQHSPPRTPPRQQELLPPAQRQPPPPPRKSGRERKIPVRPDNVYGDKRNPVDLHREDRRRALGKERQDLRQEIPLAPPVDEQMVPGPSSPDTKDRYHDAPQDTESQLAKLAQEGGVGLINYLLAKAVADDEPLPSQSSPREWTFRDILRMPKQLQEEWKKACYEELESLRKRQVFELTELPLGRKAIRNRWVFDIKTDGRKKARLVAKGFSQVEGIDYDEVFSPVVRFETVRIMFALAALNSWHISGLDVKTAFLYGKLDEEIYMEQPEGFKIKGQERKVLRLRRAIYGLKQAALAWWRELANSLKEMGFKRLYSDAGIFICRHSDGTFAIIVAYVDD